jgi:serine phosphatase RsbU (regulator of sigma subunit)
MKLKKVGRVLIALGILFISTALFLESADHFASFKDTATVITVTGMLSSVIFIGLGITFIYFNAEEKKRKRAIKIIGIVCSAVLAFALYSKRHWYAGASIEFIVSLFIFSFAGLPLIIKSRYERRKDLFTQKQILLSYLDLFAFALIILSVLFKIMHWPGSVQMLTFGIVGFLISTLSWHRSFEKEVRLRKKAEQDVKHAFLELEEKNKEVLDSITYAQRIQKALLAGESMLKKNLPDHFVLFKPKDIVSGDFYWACEAHGKFYFIVADSTGHGVPGAFMSLLNISFLNEAINEKGIQKPNEILAHVRLRLIGSLAIEGSNEGGNDGMDCILMCLDKTKTKLEVSCAHNPLLIIHNNELKEIAADKIPVGKSVKNEIPFTLHSLDLKKDDTLYAFTDGFADQFGGPNGKKLKYKQLCGTLLENKDLPLQTQKENLLKLFSAWKGNLEQVDDVLIAGIRI